MPASWSMVALTDGCAFSASTAAFAKNGRNESLTPSRAWKSALAAVAAGDPGDVDLDHGGQLRADLQRLDHAVGDDLAQPRQLLGPAAHRGVGRGRRATASRPAGAPRDAAAARCGRLLGGGEHVLLADPAADAGAGDRARSTPCSAASLRTSGVT